MLPTITVITPSFNQGKFIGQTVESILNQCYLSYEHIVLDALSTDNTLDVLQSYRKNRNLKIISEADKGQTDALNKGLRMATGEIVCWLNSDDVFLPGTLNMVGKFFVQNPQELWLTGDCVIINESGITIQQPIRRYKQLLRRLTPIAYLGATNAICQPSTFWRRSVHEQLGFLDESLRYTMDYDWWLRLNTLQPPNIINTPLAAFRVHSLSKGGSEYEMQFIEDYETLCRYQPNLVIRALHKIHNRLIVEAYRLLK